MVDKQEVRLRAATMLREAVAPAEIAGERIANSDVSAVRRIE